LLALAAVGFTADRISSRMPSVRTRAAVALASVIGLGAAIEASPLVRAAARSVRAPETRDQVMPDGFEFVNAHTPPDAKLLLLDFNRGFFLEREYVADSSFEASQVNGFVRQAGDEASLAARLRELGITHIFAGPRRWGIPYPPWLDQLLHNPARAAVVHRCPAGRCTVYHLLVTAGPWSPGSSL
jgi:hypothetical protein